MKRATLLFEQMVSFDNLRLAWVKARKGKMKKPAVKNYAAKVNENLYLLQERMKTAPIILEKYSQFKVYDPKERLISVVPFSDRVMHHAIMNILEPVFERQFIFHTYACRKYKGTHRAVRYVHTICKRGEGNGELFFLKLDVKKYFDNISHHVLKHQLERIIKDECCLNLLNGIIDSYNSGVNGTGLPIGNLTSQFFANIYLSWLDHYVLEQLRPFGYVRYMDDILVFDLSKGKLKSMYRHIFKYCQGRLFVELKTPVIEKCSAGVPFLGYIINSQSIKLTNRSIKRKKKKLNRLNYAFEKGLLSEEKYATRVKCMYAVQAV